MAAEELSRIRSELVARMLKPTIKEISDGLLQDGILVDEERDTILEEKIRAEQARILVDYMIKRGNLACIRMIEHLGKSDLALYQELAQHFYENAQPAKELLRARPLLVESVSKPLIKQLLDDLLKDKILGDEEKYAILEERIRADQARVLVDSVRRKGDRASKKMFEYLQKKDPILYLQLNNRLTEDAQPGAEWSPTLKHTTEAFWREKQEDIDVYPATKKSIRNRVALLITNIKFTIKKYNRDGAEKDEENMEKLLSALGYEVVKHTNLTAEEIDNALDEFSRHSKLQHTDSVIVVIMSHGDPGSVFGIDHNPGIIRDEFFIDEICKHLGPQKCEALKDKPKIIIIQACRGGSQGSFSVECSSQAVADEMQSWLSLSADDLEEDSFKIFEHQETDFIFLHSSTRDAQSYRHPEKGSVFILAIVGVVNTLAHKFPIDTLFMKVARCVRRFFDVPTVAKKQMPSSERCTLDREFYFFPGI